MATLTYETLKFRQTAHGVEVTLLNLAKTLIPTEDMERMGLVKVEKHSLEFNNNKVDLRFAQLLEKYFGSLKNNLTGNKVTYIHRNSEIPLLGNVAFGIVHRGSSIIEIKPVTSCNLDCVYCSISEGLSSKKNDFIVEEEYMIQEVEKVLEEVNESVEIHVGVQGEPFLYADMDLLLSDLNKMDLVHTISIDTNGTFLTMERIDRLCQLEKLQLNLSLDAIDMEVARKMAGVKSYNVEHVKKMIEYASSKMKVIVAPVLTQGYNEEEVEKIVEWVSGLNKKPILGIQNFLKYKTGRSGSEEMPWDDFYALLDRLEKKYDIKLRLSKEDFNIRKLPGLKKPFVIGSKVSAMIKCIDRFPNSVIAVADGRNISVPGCKFVKDKKIMVEILRDKHNVFTGKLCN